jgi:hypothetical protein
MTIDTLIRMLEEARALLPSGGQARVVFPDLNIVRSVTPEKDYHALGAAVGDIVVLSDYGDDDPREITLPELFDDLPDGDAEAAHGG